MTTKMFKTMWTLGKSSSQTGIRPKESLAEDLHQEVRTAAPGARLSCILRNNLERLDKSERKEIVSVLDRDRQDGCAPLFIACKKGNLEIVEYLIETCGADVEQKGVYEVIDDKTTHRVSPLWCASVSGRINIVKCLVKHGANVNSFSDTGSTPVRSACFMTNYDVVQYLVECAGADIQLPNYNGGTCLINSVQSSALCEYLLANGAEVNSQDIQLKTALHYAIQEHRFETTKLLLSHGANPFLKNRYGDDALQTSCLKGATLIFNYLLDNISYPPERRAEMHELMGSTFLDEHHDIQMALQFWRKAIEIRTDAACVLPKRQLDYAPLYAYGTNADGTEMEIKEFVTSEDLDAVSADLDAIRINSLLIAERILVKSHKDVIFRIMYRGAAYADSSQFIYCIRLWRYALQLRIQKDSLLYADTCFTALALIRLYLDLDRQRELNQDKLNQDPLLPVEDLMGTFILLVDELPTCASLVKIRPIFKRQHESFDRCLRCCTHLIYLLLKVPNKTPEQFAQIKKVTKNLVKHDLRMCLSGDSLLHMAVSRNNIVRSHFFVDDHQVSVFPSVEVAKFLIGCGADVNATNDNRATPLHLVVSNDNFNPPIVKLLLENGSHADQLDNANQSPIEILQVRAHSFDFSLLQHVSLKCIASKVICSMGVVFNQGDLPRELEQFLELHRPTPPDDGQGSSVNKNNKLSKQARAN